MSTTTKKRISDFTEKLTEYFLHDMNIVFALYFGSYVQKRRRLRDLDVAIYFKDPPKGINLLFLINNLSNLSDKEVDLVVLNNASVFVRHQVMKYGIPAVIKNRDMYRRFREKTIADYDEYKFVSGLNTYDR